MGCCRFFQTSNPFRLVRSCFLCSILQYIWSSLLLCIEPSSLVQAVCHRFTDCLFCSEVHRSLYCSPFSGLAIFLLKLSRFLQALCLCPQFSSAFRLMCSSFSHTLLLSVILLFWASCTSFSNSKIPSDRFAPLSRLRLFVKRSSPFRSVCSCFFVFLSFSTGLPLFLST